jgi:hypothetical protein
LLLSTEEEEEEEEEEAVFTRESITKEDLPNKSGETPTTVR